MTGRLFSDDQLATLGRSPWLAVPEALAAGRWDEVEQLVGDLEAGCKGQIDRYTGWLSSIFEFLAERWGRDGDVALVRATRAFFATSPDVAAVDADDPRPAAGEIAAAARDQGSAVGNEMFEDVIRRWRQSIDLHRDWISALLSSVYRDHGPDELEALLRYCGTRGLAGAMKQHIQGSPQDRLVNFVRLLHGHFTELTVSEDDRKFTITQDLCGTCSRQILDGRYGPPLNLALVSEPHAVTWGRGNTTVYRSHVPIWHVEMAREQLGVPWPVNQCPDGLDPGVCRILLYKDPLDPEAESQIPRAAAGRGAV